MMKSAMRMAGVAIVAVAMAGTAGAQDGDEPKGWTGEVSASITAQTGTTDTFAGSVDATGQRNRDRDEVGVRFNASYGTTRNRDSESTTTNQNQQALFADWKRIINDRFFWDSGAELSRDSVVDREVRASVFTGPGYRAWAGPDPATEHFDLSVGIGYRFELYNVTSGVPDRDNFDPDHFADVVAGFEYKNMLFEDRIEYTHTGSARMPANDPEAFVLTSEAILGLPLTEAWSLRLSFFVEYLNVQPARVQNTTTRSTLGLGYKF